MREFTYATVCSGVECCITPDTDIAFRAYAGAKVHLSIGDNMTPTLTCGTSIGVCTQHRARRIMPIECERLMGYPDNYTRIPYRGKPAEQVSGRPALRGVRQRMGYQLRQMDFTRHSPISNREGGQTMSKPKSAQSEYAAIVRKFSRIFAISEAQARAEIAARTKKGERPITCARALIKTLVDKNPRRIANEVAKGGFMADVPYEAVLEAARQMRHDARFPGRAYKPLGGSNE